MTKKKESDVDVIARHVRRVEKKVDGVALEVSTLTDKVKKIDKKLDSTRTEINQKIDDSKDELSKKIDGIIEVFDKKNGAYVEIQAEEMLGGKHDEVVHLGDKVKNHERRIKSLERQ